MGTPRDGHGHRAYRRAQAFAADDPNALANGGRFAGQQPQPVHRHCNASKGDSADIEIWPAS